MTTAESPRPLVSPRFAYAGAFVSGLLYWLGFPGFGVWPLAFIAFTPLFIVLRGQTPKVAARLGWLTGTTMNVCGFYWLLVMLRTFSGFPTVACAFFMVVVCAYQGGRLALMGWLYARAEKRGWPAAPVFLGAFVASELVYPLLFPWYYGASLSGVPALAQIADIGGPVLVGALLSLTSIAFAEPLLARLEKRDMERKPLAWAFGAVAVTLAYGLFRIHQVDALVAAAPSVKVGVVQGNMGLLAKREDPAEGLRRHIATTDALRKSGADFVVWSESSVTFPVHEDMARQMMKARVGQRIHVPAIFGGVLYTTTPHEHWYNVALSTNAAGDLTARYDKEYLLQFGEHLPFSEWFPILNEWSPNSGRFTPGTKLDPLLIAVGDETHKIATLVCYEDILPGFTNDLVDATDPDMLVNITNDAWFGATTEPWEHMALAEMRAIEHRRYLVRSTNSGVSAIVDPVGRVVAHTEVHDVQHGSYDQADSLLETVKWMHGGKTMYERVGNWPWWMVTVLALATAFSQKKQGSKQGVRKNANA